MSKRFPLWALMCLTAPIACFAKTSALETDSLPAIHLQEVTVKVRPVISKSGGNAYIPSSDKKRFATSGLDLLQKMQLPRVSVNPLTAGVVVAGAPSVTLYINGVVATSAEVAALSPADIIRVEYYDNPGVKYSDPDAVIDFITRRHDSGGELSAETMTAVGNGKWASFDDLSGRYSHGPSTVTFNINYVGLHRDNWLRDYEETWHYPDASLCRQEVGLPVTIGQSAFGTQLNYSLSRDRRYFFNLRAAMDYDYIPGNEEGDRHTLLHTSGSDAVTEIREHTRERGTAPSLALHYKLFTGGYSSVTANLSGTYHRSHSHHSYAETADAAAPAEIVSDVLGSTYSWHGEAYYETRVGASHIISGIRHSWSLASNSYTGTSEADVRFHSAESSAFGEYDVRLDRLSLLANLSAARMYVSQANIRCEKYSLLPSAGASYEPCDAFRARYDVKLRDKLPPLATMSDVEQQIQPGLVRRGNPEVKAFHVIDQRLTLSFFHEKISADLLIDYRHEHRPVMSSTFFDGQQFVTSYFNQRSFRELRWDVSLGVHPWSGKSGHLSIMLSPSLCRYFSRGVDYRHACGIFHLGIGADFSYRQWILSGNVMTGAANTMYGEEITSEKDMNMLLVGYKMPRWSVQVGGFNLFMKDYWMKTENFAALTPYTSKAHCGRNAYAVVKLSVKLDFGHHSTASDTPDFSTHEIDTGIMNGLK